jgi:hypothetical protein
MKHHVLSVVAPEPELNGHLKAQEEQGGSSGRKRLGDIEFENQLAMALQVSLCNQPSVYLSQAPTMSYYVTVGWHYNMFLLSSPTFLR